MKSLILYSGAVIFFSACYDPETGRRDQKLQPMKNDELMQQENNKPTTSETYRFNNGMIIMPNEPPVRIADSAGLFR